MPEGKSPRHAAQQESADVSEAEIAVHWPEEDYVPPAAQFIAQANLTDPRIFERFSLDRFPSASRSSQTCWIGTNTGK